MRYYHHLYLFAFLLVAFLPSVRAATPSTSDQIIGHWYMPARQSSVDIYRVGDRYFARVTDVGGSWQKNFARLKGQVIMSDLAFKGQEWSGGELIHPETGLHLDVALTIKNSQTIIATLYKGIRWLHKDFVLVRQPLTT